MTMDPPGPRYPQFSQETQGACPKCEDTRIEALPANNPGSGLEWFRCAACDHLWSERRDCSEQGHAERL